MSPADDRAPEHPTSELRDGASPSKPIEKPAELSAGGDHASTGKPGSSARLKLPKAARMPAGGPYARVFQCRKAVSDETIILNFAPNGLPWHRLGLGVAKKMFRKAVTRNRVKRLIREAFRLERPGFGGGLDIVIRPRAHELSVNGLRASLRVLVPKAERKFAASQGGTSPGTPPDGGTTQAKPGDAR